MVFGRKPRNVFFVDDNLIGHKPKAKELLRSLVEYQRERGHPFHFGTEASVNVAEDAELLQLLRDANFGWIFTGIESPNDASLKETLKLQNTRGSLLESVKAIHGSGIGVQAGFIVGFDADDETIFERQFRFIQDAGRRCGPAWRRRGGFGRRWGIIRPGHRVTTRGRGPTSSRCR